MKRPNDIQLRQLQDLGRHGQIVDYLKEVEQDYKDQLVTAQTEAEIRQIQGAASTVHRLIELITSNVR